MGVGGNFVLVLVEVGDKVINGVRVLVTKGAESESLGEQPTMKR